MTGTPFKTALVTGGSRGLGKEIALSLARDGVGVLLTYHSREDEADAVVKAIRDAGGRAAALRFDVAAPRSFDGFLAEARHVFLAEARHVLLDTFGSERLDFLINNAGFGKAISIERLTEEDFETFSNVHFKGVVFLTQKSLAMMNDGGAVVFITAAGDRYVVPDYAIYAACKGAVEVFSRYVAKEFGPRGIRANTVAPGGVATDFNNAAIRKPRRISRRKPPWVGSGCRTTSQASSPSCAATRRGGSPARGSR